MTLGILSVVFRLGRFSLVKAPLSGKGLIVPLSDRGFLLKQFELIEVFFFGGSPDTKRNTLLFID